MHNAEDDRRDGCQDVGGTEGSGHGQLDRDCCGGDSDWLADLEAKQREYDAHCDFLYDQRIEREIREGSIE
jgi:hypothetical protein